MSTDSPLITDSFKSSGKHDGLQSKPRFRLKWTWQGKFFTALLFITFIGSMNFQNNLGMLTAVFVAYCLLVSGVMASLAIYGMRLVTGPVQPVFCGDNLQLPINLELPHAKAPVKLTILCNHDRSYPHRLEYRAPATKPYHICLPALRRGKQTINSITILSVHLLGAFEAQITFPVHVEYLIYPMPALAGSTTRHGDTRTHQQIINIADHHDYDGQRPYLPGDSIKHINWKSFAASKGLNTHQFIEASDQVAWLEWHDCPAQETELRLSQLTRAVIDLSHIGQDFGLRLPGNVIAPGCGVNHRNECLAVLAQFLLSTDEATTP